VQHNFICLLLCNLSGIDELVYVLSAIVTAFLGCYSVYCTYLQAGYEPKLNIKIRVIEN
jgi:hypothetical protein